MASVIDHTSDGIRSNGPGGRRMFFSANMTPGGHNHMDVDDNIGFNMEPMDMGQPTFKRQDPAVVRNLPET